VKRVATLAIPLGLRLAVLPVGRRARGLLLVGPVLGALAAAKTCYSQHSARRVLQDVGCCGLLEVTVLY
jgi:hypothetical protein